MKLEQTYSFGSILSIELAKISDHKSMYSTRAQVVLLINYISLMSYAVHEPNTSNPGYSYFYSFLSALTDPPMSVGIAGSVLKLLLNLFLVFQILSLSYETFKTQNKTRKRILLARIIETTANLTCPIVSVNAKILNQEVLGWKIVPIINLVIYSVFVLCYFYFFRAYKFNQQGFYREFDFLQCVYYIAMFSIVCVKQFISADITPFMVLPLVSIQLIELIMNIPYKISKECDIYLFCLVSTFIISLIGILNQMAQDVNQNNVFESYLLTLPGLYTLCKQILYKQWDNLVSYMKENSNSKKLNIKKQTISLEALIHYVEKARTDQNYMFLCIQILKFHVYNCNDQNCECKSNKDNQQSQLDQSMTHRSSFHSKTALLSNQDKQSGNQNQSQNLDFSQLNKTIKDFSQQGNKAAEFQVKDTYFAEIQRKVSNIQQQMRFMFEDRLDEELIAKYIRRQFHSTIQQLSFTLNLEDVEYLSMKYISFMYTFKQNSPSSLVKLRQIQSRSSNFSYFFQNISKVTEEFLVDAILHKHTQESNHFEESFHMNVNEIWRLETIKDIVVNAIVLVLRKKIKVWEELCSGEVQTMDKFLDRIIIISKQIESSKAIVDSILSDFPKNVQRNYSYYLKYQCFRALFFESDYKTALSYQRRVEDAWQLSKATHRQGQLGNYQWLCGDLVTLEVSIAVSNGTIIKGVSQRLVELMGFDNYEDMLAHLKIRSVSSSQHNHNQQINVQSLMPPFLMASHQYFITRFIQRGYTNYYSNAIGSFISNAEGFIFPINVHLSFNFQNFNDFTLLGSILKIKDDSDYLIFDEWGRILGVSKKMFDKLIIKGSLDEFGQIQFQFDNKLKKYDKLGNLKNQIINKIAQDDNAKLFKKMMTMTQKQSVNSRATVRRTYSKPSDILLQFGSIQHFIPQVGKQMSELLAKDIFKKLQRESQQQFNKLTEKAANQYNNNYDKFEKQTSNIFQRQISAMIERQSSLNGGLSSNMLDKDQYRNFLKNNFFDEDGTMKRTQQILQDEKLTVFIPKNYNELIEYFNDAGDRYMESKGDNYETRSIRRQQLQNKYSYVRQQQNCYHVFDADFQDFIDNKVRKYYSKSLLKEAIQTHDAKFLQMVRYKALVSVDVGIGGVSDDDQFLYFVCKLSNLNLMTAKRRDVLKLHLKKDKRQQFDAGEDLRKSLLQIQSQDSFDNFKPRLSQMDSYPSFQEKDKIRQSAKEAPSSAMVVSLAIPSQRSYQVGNERDEGPNLKIEFNATQQKLNESSFEIDSSMKDSLINSSMRQSLNVPILSRQNSWDKLREYQKQQTQKQQQQQQQQQQQSEDQSQSNHLSSHYGLQSEKQPEKQQQKSKLSFAEIVKQSSSSSNAHLFQQQQSQSISDPQVVEPNEPPKKRLKLSFLKKMEQALTKPEQPPAESPAFKSPSIVNSVVDSGKRNSSLLSPGGPLGSSNNLFSKLFQRLNLRRVSNVEIKNDVFEQQQDQGFKEQQSQESDSRKSNSLSQSNSMSSNNISMDAVVNEEDDMKNLEDDELVNIFEVMSQASNHQSIKSISAISMATNISLRCLKYMPRQATSLQFFKFLLISLNIAGIISLIMTTQNYFDSLQPDQLSQDISNRYKYLVITFSSANEIDQENIITFQTSVNQSMLIDILSDTYDESSKITQSYFNIIDQLEKISFPLKIPELLVVPSDFQTPSLADYLTNDKIELDSIQYTYAYHSNQTDDYKQYNSSMDFLLKRVLFNQAQINDMVSQLISINRDFIDNKSLLITILMASFAGMHFLVIFFIIPYIKQINDIYWRVLQIVSRVSPDEAVDEIKKLTLSQHLLSSTDDSWVTSNQIKLVFYNRNKELDFNNKYTKTTKSKGKESSYFQTKLIDTQLSIWKDMILYISISAISIGYLLFSIILIQTQVNQFSSYISHFDQTVQASLQASSLLSKLSYTPERYMNIPSSNSIPSQHTLYNFQLGGQITYLLQSINNDQINIRDYMNDLSNYQEQINLDYDFSGDQSKVKATLDTFSSRLTQLQQLSVLSEINHLLKDNLCYYSSIDICFSQQEIDYYNTGLIGALDVLAKFAFNYESFLKDYHTIAYSDSVDATLKSSLSSYYNTQEFNLLVHHGQLVFSETFERLMKLMAQFLEIEKGNKNEIIKDLFLGIGIPIMILTFILAILEMIQLKQKVRRVMLSLTYIPTFKFQEKIMLSLIKAVLKL